MRPRRGIFLSLKDYLLDYFVEPIVKSAQKLNLKEVWFLYFRIETKGIGGIKWLKTLY